MERAEQSARSMLLRGEKIAIDKWQTTGYHIARNAQAHSSSGSGRRPLKAEITGSTPVCATRKRQGISLLVFFFSPIPFTLANLL